MVPSSLALKLILFIEKAVSSTSASLDVHKNWYVLTKELCRGTRPVGFVRNAVFQVFPDEVKVLASRELEPANSVRWNRQPRNLCIASSFGLCAGLLRKRDIAPNGMIRSPNFKSVVSVINAISLDLETSKAPIDSGGKSPRDQPSRILIDSLQAELSTLQDQIKKLESQIEEKSPGDSISLSASSPASTTKSCCSSPTCSSHSSPKPTTSSPSSSASSSSIEDIKSTMMRKLVKISDCRASSFLKALPGCRVSRHVEKGM